MNHCELCGCNCRRGGMAIGGKRTLKRTHRVSGQLNPWIEHVKNVQQQYNVSYKEAMQIAKKTY